jgi:hypothetical protein
MSGQVGQSSGKASVIGVLGAFILGTVLIIATFGKVVAPIVFVEQIRNEGLDLFFSANIVALIALAVEMWLGVALILGDRSRWILYPTALLVAFFLLLTGRAYWLVLTGQLDNTYDCGCFGVFLQRTATEAFWQDLFLLATPLLMCFVGRKPSSDNWPGWRFWIGFASAFIIVLYAVFVVGMPENEPVPGGVVLEQAEFQRTGDYSLIIEGVEDPGARIFQSDLSLQFLILSSELEVPLLLDLRKNRVLAISPEEIERKGEDDLDLRSTQGVEELGTFEVGSEGLSLALDGREISIRSR